MTFSMDQKSLWKNNAFIYGHLLTEHNAHNFAGAQLGSIDGSYEWVVGWKGSDVNISSHHPIPLCELPFWRECLILEWQVWWGWIIYCEQGINYPFNECIPPRNCRSATVGAPDPQGTVGLPALTSSLLRHVIYLLCLFCLFVSRPRHYFPLIRITCHTDVKVYWLHNTQITSLQRPLSMTLRLIMLHPTINCIYYECLSRSWSHGAFRFEIEYFYFNRVAHC